MSDSPVAPVPFSATLSAEAYAQLVACVARSDSRYSLNGVHVDLVAGRLLFASSDTHRLMVYSPAPDDVASLPADFQPITLTLAAFKARATKRKYPQPLYVIDLGAVRPAETIESQFPRYLEIVPTEPGKRRVIYAGENGIAQFNHPVALTSAYLPGALDAAREWDAGSMLRDDGCDCSPLCAMTSPWNDRRVDAVWAAFLVMPVQVEEPAAPVEEPATPAPAPVADPADLSDIF